MSMLQILNVRDYYKREGKVNIESFFKKLPYLNILLMSSLKLTTCDFYDNMDGVIYSGQYNKYVIVKSRGRIFK